MVFYVDADSFPAPARAVIGRAADRRQVEAVFVAKVRISLPKSPRQRWQPAPEGADGADGWILEQAVPGDLVFTRDLPFAARLLEKGVAVLNDRGAVWTADALRARLSERDFMKGLYQSGAAEMAGRGYGPRELKEFADAFDRVLARLAPLP